MDRNRRHFVQGIAAAVAASRIPEVIAQETPANVIDNAEIKKLKVPAMEYHSDRPLTGSVPAHAHDFDVTPNDRMFVRNNLLPPVVDIDKHQFSLKGLVDKELSYSVYELAKAFPTVTITGMLECAGSGRSNYQPRASGTPWGGTGGMGCPKWGGVRLADVLKAAGLKPDAAHVAGQGVDPGMVATAAPVIRSIPMAKAMDDNTLIAWAMNDQPLPWIHGYPLRLVVPGWVGSASTKWLSTLTVLDAPFKGTYMTGSYIVPRHAVEPGQKMPAEVVSAEAWPVKSMITSPSPNAKVKAGSPLTVRGRAWVGEGQVERVEISSDEGKSWQRAQLAAGDRRYAKYAWRTFTHEF